MAYTDEGKIQKYLTVDIDNSISSQISDWITAVETWIDRYTGKSFEVSATEDRYFDGKGGKSILVDSFVDGSITELSTLYNDGDVNKTLTEGHGEDFITYPLNSNEKNEIVLTVGNRIGNFPVGERRIKITAKFGFSEEVPKDIELIATKLAGEVLREGIKGGKLSRVQLGDYQANFQKIDEKAEALGIYQTLDMYRDIDI